MFRSFNDFEAEAVKTIGSRYNRNFLRTEYNTVVASGQMARRYLEVQEDKEVFPLLQWDAVNDQRTRPEHRRLDGTTRPADDSFWKSYWPPAGHNCRCSIRQLRSGRLTPKANAIARGKRAVPNNSPFAGNAIARGEVYNARHPYFERPPWHDYRAKDYGLRPLEKVYAKGKKPALPPGETNKRAWEERFARLYSRRGGRDNSITITSAIDQPVKIDASTLTAGSYRLAGALTEVLQNPDEVYSDYHRGRKGAKQRFTYRYMKFYAGSPVVVEVIPEGDGLRAKTASQPALRAAERQRSGVLQHVQRL